MRAVRFGTDAKQARWFVESAKARDAGVKDLRSTGWAFRQAGVGRPASASTARICQKGAEQAR